MLFLVLSYGVNAQHETTYSVDLFQPSGQEMDLIGDNDFDILDLGSFESFAHVQVPIRPFITVWKTDNLGVTSNNSIKIPALGKFTYTWEGLSGPGRGLSGSGNGLNSTEINFTYPGTYRVKITPTNHMPFNQIIFENKGDRRKLIAIEQWGDVKWNSMKDAFFGCENLNILAKDAPDLSQVTRTSSMFRACSSLNADINHWDVSNVTDMEMMFANASSFNSHLHSWDVSDVTNMFEMFRDASSFNRPLNSWEVSNVTSMIGMFYDASSFNQPLHNWDVSNVINMYAMFYNASSFNQSLGDWDFPSLQYGIEMFNGTDLSCSNYSKTLMGWAVKTNLPNNINVGADGLSYGADVLAFRNYLINTKNWIIAGDLVDENCEITPRPFITVWKTDIEDESNQSIKIPVYGEYIYRWEEEENTSNNGWGDGSDNLDLTFTNPGTYVVSITPTGSNPFHKINFSSFWGLRSQLIDIEQWGDIEWSTMESAFYRAENLNLSAIDAPNLTNVSSLNRMFYKCSSLNANINHWDVSNVTDMSFMFEGASSFDQSLNNWDVSSVISMFGMFTGASNFNQTLDSWDVSNVTNMRWMFAGASIFGNVPMDSWTIGNDTDIGWMIAETNSFNQPLGNWNVSSVSYMDGMFAGTNSFNQPLDNWDVSNVVSMEMMFAGATNFNKSLNNWDVSNVISMDGMFSEATSFNQSLEDWNLPNFEYGYEMFSGSGLNCKNYTKTLMGWVEKPNLPNNIDLGNVIGLKYGPDADAALITLSGKGWTITGHTRDASCILGPCELNIVHSGSVAPGTYKTDEKIESKGKLTGTTSYQAGRSITLTKGFKVEDGVVFEARIKGCDD